MASVLNKWNLEKMESLSGVLSEGQNKCNILIGAILIKYIYDFIWYLYVFHIKEIFSTYNNIIFGTILNMYEK